MVYVKIYVKCNIPHFEWFIFFEEEFEDNKGVNRIRKSKKDRQHYDQKKKDRQHYEQKKDR